MIRLPGLSLAKVLLKTIARASRPDFLILAPLCVLLGVQIAFRQGVPLSLPDLLLVLTAALLAHAAVNLLNEYEDFRSGLDLITQRTPFSGGSGALPEHPVAARAVLWAGIACLLGVVAIGGYFVALRGWPLLLIGLPGLLLVVGYTRWITRSPAMCLLAPGLGFGPVMLLGSLVALGGHMDAAGLLAAGSVLLFTSELLLINQFPDIAADQQVGRRHLPIILGPARAAWVVMLLLAAAFGLLLGGVLSSALPVGAALALIPLPAALWIMWRLPSAIAVPARLRFVLGVNVATLLTTLALLNLGFFFSE